MIVFWKTVWRCLDLLLRINYPEKLVSMLAKLNMKILVEGMPQFRQVNMNLYTLHNFILRLILATPSFVLLC